MVTRWFVILNDTSEGSYDVVKTDCGMYFLLYSGAPEQWISRSSWETKDLAIQHLSWDNAVDVIPIDLPDNWEELE